MRLMNASIAGAIGNLKQGLPFFVWLTGHLSVAAMRSCRYDNRMSLRKIDHWIGATLFVPPIIKFCQLTRQSQFAVSRLFWFIAAMDGLYRAETLFSSLLWGGLSIIMMVSAVRRADSPTASFMFFRLLAIFLLIVDVMTGLITNEWAGIEFWIFVLLAEYAAIIRTIPPTETRKSAFKMSRAD
jgi:hypothetical protein